MLNRVILPRNILFLFLSFGFLVLAGAGVPAPVTPEQEKGMRVYSVQIMGVHDADTFTGLVNLGLGVFKTETFRLARIDAWEVRGPEKEAGLRAKEFFESKIPPGTPLRVDTYADKKGKYGRVLAEVYFPGNGEWVNMNDLLLEEGHAELYNEGATP